MSLVGLALGLVALLAAGDRTLAWAGVSLPRGAYRFWLAFAVGLVALTTLPFWLNLLGVPLTSWLGIALGCLGLLLGGWDLFRPRRAGVQEAGTPLPAAARWALLLAALFVALATCRTLWEPLTGWDARSLWGPYAGVLYYEQSVSGPGFTDPERCLQLTNYPLLVPLARWFLAAWMGQLEDQFSLILFPVCFVATLAVVHGRLARSLRQPTPALLVALLASVPLFWQACDGSVSSGYAEVPLTLLSAGLAVCCLEWLDSRQPAWLRVAACLGTGMVFTKRGGLMIVILAFVLLLILEHRRGGALVRAGLVCGLLSLPWWLHQGTLTHLTAVRPQNYAVRLYEVAVERGGWAASAPDLALQACRQTFLVPGTWALLWWAVLVSTFTAGHRSQARRWLVLLLLLYGVGTWLYLVRGQVPWEVLGGTNWARYLVPTTPWAVLYLGLGLEEQA